MYEGFSMAGKNALITGGTRGIGLAIAKGFLQSGANVTIASRKQENVDPAVAELGNPEKVLGVAAHVGKGEDRERMINAAEGSPNCMATGIMIAMIAIGPRPGSMPMKVPTKQPTVTISKLNGDTAVCRPMKTPSNMI